MLAYDDQFSIRYFDQRSGRGGAATAWTPRTCSRTASRDYDDAGGAAARFDDELMADLRTRPAARNTRSSPRSPIRQSLGGAQARGRRRTGRRCCFSKENFSNGCIATVDVIYPSVAVLPAVQPDAGQGVARADARLRRVAAWKFPFAPHDLGTYPHANGQVYGGGERTEENQMPVEESGNMLILVAAIAKIEGNADFAEQLLAAPDASGPSTSRTRASTPRTSSAPTTSPATWRTTPTSRSRRSSRSAPTRSSASMRGDTADGDGATATLASEFADAVGRRWPTTATTSGSRSTSPDTWSQKYNLVWDRLLGLNLFPPEVARKEIAFYLTRPEPLRPAARQPRAATRSSTGSSGPPRWPTPPADFEALVDPVYRFLNETPDRVPMTDWYWTHDAQAARLPGPAGRRRRLHPDARRRPRSGRSGRLPRRNADDQASAETAAINALM